MKRILFFSILFLWSLHLIALLIWSTHPVHAQEAQYSGYYGETGPDNQSYHYTGNPIIYVFFNNDYCPSCAEAIDLIEQTYNQNFQGQYDFYLINYADEEEAGNYNFTENYNLVMPLSVVLQYVDNGQLTKYQKLPYLYYFNPYTYQEAFLAEVSTFFENEGDPFAPL